MTFPQVERGSTQCRKCGQGRGRTADLPFFRRSITPRALTWKSRQQPSSCASTLLTGDFPYLNTHNKCTGVCCFVRGFLWGSAAVSLSCGVSVGLAEAPDWPGRADPARRLTEFTAADQEAHGQGPAEPARSTLVLSR